MQPFIFDAFLTVAENCSIEQLWLLDAHLLFMTLFSQFDTSSTTEKWRNDWYLSCRILLILAGLFHDTLRSLISGMFRMISLVHFYNMDISKLRLTYKTHIHDTKIKSVISNNTDMQFRNSFTMHVHATYKFYSLGEVWWKLKCQLRSKTDCLLQGTLRSELPKSSCWFALNLKGRCYWRKLT